MTAIEVPASVGHPYELERGDHGLIRLARLSKAGRPVTIVFARSDALHVADALVDLAENAE